MCNPSRSSEEAADLVEAEVRFGDGAMAYRLASTSASGPQGRDLAAKIGRKAEPWSNSLQAMVNVIPRGVPVHAGVCVYREQVNITKPLTLVEEPGSEIRGSEARSSFEALGTRCVKSHAPPPAFL